ncbi:hypothetical protein BU24DRAFT_253371 [Aaosphaeria arxii CBS 175.79]|uniref:SGNH hydrolase-type esterase domain-containing protein n=1 Tax=Aaosphaeria arxii CBS 175.79 TaxID=1450172 RepID=A0A6A5XI75_9PLEO|nr:uncharacterized protein BU24DRAFT_253371 [Aaosphaeria arxii CBS 175.79]KAF2012521.1 hypothetical protein BU24DRAFT_253371 [Aaosphaeria arxii CBS 175.79]
MSSPQQEPQQSQPLLDPDFLARLQQHSRLKPRSHTTHQTIHLPELNSRLSLNLDIPSPSPSNPPPPEDPFTPRPDLTTKTPITAIYLGNSMLERLKTTGSATKTASQVPGSWNAGCGGDRNENVIYRCAGVSELGLFDVLRRHGGSESVKLWVLVSGTNNLHPKRGLREADVESWRVLVEGCLRVAPGSRLLACDMFYRLDVSDELVDRGNDMLKGIVGDINREFGEERVVWIESRGAVGKDMLVDHVHLDERGYQAWDNRLFPFIRDTLGLSTAENK